MDHKLIHFLERPFIQQEIDPFPSCEFTGLVLPFGSLLSPADFSKFFPLPQLFQFFVYRHGLPSGLIFF
jgi:hypothetical protein